MRRVAAARHRAAAASESEPEPAGLTSVRFRVIWLLRWLGHRATVSVTRTLPRPSS